MMKLLRRFFLDSSLKVKMAVIYTMLMVIIVLLIGFVIYGFCLQRMVEGEKSLLQRGQLQTMSLIDARLGTFLTKSQILFSNTDLQAALSKQYNSTNSSDIYFAYQNQIYAIINPVTQDFIFPDYSLAESDPGSIASNTKFIIYLDNPTLNKDGGTILDYQPIKDEPWVKATLEAQSGIRWESSVVYKNMPYISLNRALKDIIHKKNLGVMTFLIPKSIFNSIISKGNANPEMQWALVDTSGNIVSSNSKLLKTPGEVQKILNSTGQNLIGETMLNNSKFICSTVVSRINDWTLISLYPYKSVTKDLNSIFYVVSVVLLAAALVSIGASVLIASIMTKRLDTIMDNMDGIKRDRNAALAVVPGNDEIGRLNAAFVDMVMNVNALVEREKQLHRRSTAMKVELLMSQINPHILYNTLATIGWVAKKSKLVDLEDITDTLIRFFKNFLNKGALITTVQHEMDMILQYTSILKFTYQLDIDVKTEFDEGINQYACLNLVLQPIVENAIIHGIKPMHRPGHLLISGRIEGKNLVFTVTDSGVGMPQQAIEMLKQGITASKTGGYGLFNVIQRIGLYYGDESAVEFHSIDNVGTTVHVRIPALTEEQLNAIVNEML